MMHSTRHNLFYAICLTNTIRTYALLALTQYKYNSREVVRFFFLYSAFLFPDAANVFKCDKILLLVNLKIIIQQQLSAIECILIQEYYSTILTHSLEMVLSSTCYKLI